MKRVNHIAFGMDPAFRRSGFTVSIRDLSDRTLRFKQFNRFFDFLLWAQEQSFQLQESGYSWSVGIENSYLVKKYFKLNQCKTRAELINRVGKAALNRAVSHTASEACKFYFGEENVWDFRPLKRGRDVTGGKKPHSHFAAICKTQSLTVYDYPEIPHEKRNKITNNKDQDMRDAFFVGEYALTKFRFKKRNAPLNK